MTIYIDAQYHCHADDPDGDRRAFELAFFDGKSDRFIEGWLYIPPGEAVVTADGKVLMGEKLETWQSYALLAELQRQHEESQALNADLVEAMNILGVSD